MLSALSWKSTIVSLNKSVLPRRTERYFLQLSKIGSGSDLGVAHAESDAGSITHLFVWYVMALRHHCRRKKYVQQRKRPNIILPAELSSPQASFH